MPGFMGRFMGRSPERRRLNGQFVFYGLTLFLIALMLMLVKRKFGTP